MLEGEWGGEGGKGKCQRGEGKGRGRREGGANIGEREGWREEC